MLAMSDRYGRVWASIPGLAKEAAVTLDACQIAIDKFMAPDPYSRTKIAEGRRIEPIDGGWQLINHAKYRSIRDVEERRAYKTQKQREYRSVDNYVDKVDESGQALNGVDSGGHIAEADTKKIKPMSDLFGNDEVEILVKPQEEVIEAAWNYYKTTFSRNGDYTFSKTRRNHADKAWAALKRKCKIDGVPEVDQPDTILNWLCDAIDNLKADKFHNGENEHRKKYNDWENLFSGGKRHSPDKLTDYWLDEEKFPNRRSKP
jgi:hypothetical protein